MALSSVLMGPIAGITGVSPASSTASSPSGSGGFWEDLLGGGVRAATLMNVAGNIRDEGKDARQDLGLLADEAVAGTSFRPYTVTANTGNVGYDGNDIQFNLNPNQVGVSDQLLSGAQGLFSDSLADRGAREQDLYNKMAAIQDPQIERDRQALEQRLYAQGRSGVGTAQYGGTPEMFAQEKAIQEARNQMALSAVQQANAEQLQNANIGTQYLQNSYLPESQLMNAFNPAIQISDLGQTGQIAGQNLNSQLGLGGVQTKVNSDLAAANLYAGLFDSLANVAGNVGGRIDDSRSTGTGLWDSIKGAFGL